MTKPEGHSWFKPAPGVFFANYQSELIVLDLNTDRYLALGPATSTAVLTQLCSTDELPIADNEQLYPVISRGLLVSSSIHSPLNIPTPLEAGGVEDEAWLPHRSIILNDVYKPTINEVIAALRAIHWANRQFRSKGTGGIVNPLKKIACRSAMKASKQQIAANSIKESHGSTLGRLIEAHIRARMIYPHEIECLVGSAALAVHAWNKKIKVNFVIGVQKYPFYAHAYVQFLDVAVNDKPDVARRLAPILTISCES